MWFSTSLTAGHSSYIPPLVTEKASTGHLHSLNDLRLYQQVARAPIPNVVNCVLGPSISKLKRLGDKIPPCFTPSYTVNDSLKPQSHQAYDQVATNVRSKLWQSYWNLRNSARLVLEVVDDRKSKIGRGKVFEHVRRQSHQAYEQVTIDVWSKMVRIVLKSQQQRTSGLRGRGRS